MLSHVVTHPGAWKAADIEIEQDRDRPYVYVSRLHQLRRADLRHQQPARSRRRSTTGRSRIRSCTAASARWTASTSRSANRYYYAQSYQFMQGSPDADLGAVIFDVTGLPDPRKVKVVARIRYPQSPGGFHNTFAYKHSDGRVLYFATVNESKALIYDLDKVVSGATRAPGSSATCPTRRRSSRSAAAGITTSTSPTIPAPHQDKFYGAGLGGYSVWDVTQPETPKQLFTITGLGHGHRAHVHAVARRPVRGDRDGVPVHAAPHLGPDRRARRARRRTSTLPISAWTADWRDLSHNHEVRWPYVFVSAYEDGLQIFNLKDPKHPKTDGHYLHLRVRARARASAARPDNGWQSTTSV